MLGIELEYIENAYWEYEEVYRRKGVELRHRRLRNGLVDTRNKTVLFRREEEGKQLVG